VGATPGAIAAGHPATVAAATAVLELGGNAYDAAVAAGFAAAVAEPGLTSLGGGGFLLAQTAAGEEVLVDFFVDTPGRGLPRDALDPHFTPVTIRFQGATQVFHAGYGSVAVPGCLAGYLHVHRRWGRLDLEHVVAPARQLARHGVVVNEQQAEILGLLERIFSLTPDGSQLFAPEGAPLRAGDLARNPELGDLLDELAAGRVDGFASPVLAAPLASAMAANGGLVTDADLAAYEVVERPPLVVDVGGVRIATNPPPSFGGSLITRALTRFGRFDRDWTAPSTTTALVEALVEVDAHHRAPGPQSTKGTTHVSIADGEGNLASMTTSNGSCSGIFVPGTGVQLNNIMGEEDLHPDGFHTSLPGVRVGSMMAPTIVVLPDGERVVLGSGGSERIRSALTTVIARVGGGSPLGEAVEHPRVHWDGSTAQLEPGWASDVLAALRERWPVNEWPQRNLFFGGVHAVTTAGRAVGDARRGGSTGTVPSGS
jgi:gamma-glutamyltranspeptidase/glutathione hydrolase